MIYNNSANFYRPYQMVVLCAQYVSSSLMSVCLVKMLRITDSLQATLPIYLTDIRTICHLYRAVQRVDSSEVEYPLIDDGSTRQTFAIVWLRYSVQKCQSPIPILIFNCDCEGRGRAESSVRHHWISTQVASSKLHGLSSVAGSAQTVYADLINAE